MMKSTAGLWIDHQKAVIVFLSEVSETTKQIASDIEKHVRFSSGTSESSSEDSRDRKQGGHLDSFYDEVIAALGETEVIQIFGPGEAKVELETRLKHAGLKGPHRHD